MYTLETLKNAILTAQLNRSVAYVNVHSAMEVRLQANWLADKNSAYNDLAAAANSGAINFQAMLDLIEMIDTPAESGIGDGDIPADDTSEELTPDELEVLVYAGEERPIWNASQTVGHQKATAQLTQRGFLEQHGNWYQITKLGRNYLRAEMFPAEQSEIERLKAQLKIAVEALDNIITYQLASETAPDAVLILRSIAETALSELVASS